MEWVSPAFWKSDEETELQRDQRIHLKFHGGCGGSGQVGESANNQPSQGYRRQVVSWLEFEIQSTCRERLLVQDSELVG